MEHNQQLNEIAYLLKKYCYENDINTETGEDLTQLDILLTEIKDSLPRINLEFPEPFISTEKFDLRMPLKYEEAKRYMIKFKKHFALHPQLSKVFHIKSSLLEESIKNNEKVIFRLIQFDESFELAYLANGEPLRVDQELDRLETINDLSTLEDNFDKKIGKELDKNLHYLSNGENLNNTRKITINYYGNFDGKDFEDHEYVYLYPALIDNCSKDCNHQFTFIMFFGDKPSDSGKIESLSPDIYYDTFQLCPPNC
ncbi:hypothetical protein NAT51_02835 [Flavobacterium amniphilum]|uniref:hypothetical protein n=1 Tax=Flavobacterium amniphilum TaxID=1834035 RepID=UPI002029B58F|nr:hypothetical protein [Flavobacterium amniphilum]MCL9804440.1 hypothetical protein [Flavobacterium amniphilum]